MKRLKGILLTMLALAMIFIPTGMIKAQGIAVDADTASEVTEFETEVWTDATKDPSYKTYQVQLTVDESGKAEYIVPINIPNKGLLFVGFKKEEADSLNTDVDLYEDIECQNSIYISSTNNCAKIEEAGTYYFKFSVSDYRETKGEKFIFGIQTCVVSGDNMTLKNKEQVISAFVDYTNPIYYKVSVSNPGTITFNVEGESSSYVTLCNSKKKALTDEVSSSYTDGEYVYAVGKGTYYIKVKSYAEMITAKSTVKSVKDMGGASKAKATKLTIGAKNKSGLVLATDKSKKADWFKFYNSKNQKVTVNITGIVQSGEVRIEMYYSNGKKFSSSYAILNEYRKDASFSPYVARLGATSGKLPKGTYYIKIIKDDKVTTGTYSIKVKNK